MAAVIAAQGGELRTSELLWAEIDKNADNDQLRKSAEDHLAALTAEKQIRDLNALLDRYQKKQGRDARSFDELVSAGLLPAVPRDPSGAPYVLGGDGRAALLPSSPVDLRLIR